MTRIFVILNIAVVVLASIMLAYFYKKLNFKKRKVTAAILMIAIFGAVVVEYQTSTRPFAGNDYGTFSYVNSVPKHYMWLKKQSNIKTIAEYPLERSGGEGNSMAYYLTMQVVHGKKLFNGSIPFSIHEKKKTGLKNLYDPQTVPVLKAMGIDAIVIHGLSKEDVEKIPHTKIIYASPTPGGFSAIGFSPLVLNAEVYIVSLDNVSPQNFIIAPQDNFYRNMDYIHSAVDWEYLASSGGVLKIVGLNGKPQNGEHTICFDAKVAKPATSTTLLPTVDGVPLSGVPLDSTFKPIRLTAKDSIILNLEPKNGIVVSSLGCAQ